MKMDNDNVCYNYGETGGILLSQCSLHNVMGLSSSTASLRSQDNQQAYSQQIQHLVKRS